MKVDRQTHRPIERIRVCDAGGEKGGQSRQICRMVREREGWRSGGGRGREAGREKRQRETERHPETKRQKWEERQKEKETEQPRESVQTGAGTGSKRQKQGEAGVTAVMESQRHSWREMNAQKWDGDGEPSREGGPQSWRRGGAEGLRETHTQLCSQTPV